MYKICSQKKKGGGSSDPSLSLQHWHKHVCTLPVSSILKNVGDFCQAPTHMNFFLTSDQNFILDSKQPRQTLQIVTIRVLVAYPVCIVQNNQVQHNHLLSLFLESWIRVPPPKVLPFGSLRFKKRFVTWRSLNQFWRGNTIFSQAKQLITNPLLCPFPLGQSQFEWLSTA